VTIASPAQALWNERATLPALAGRLRALIKAVDRPGDFAPFQWAQVAAFALGFRPDLIVELGRGLGNSTCCFLEVSARLRPAVPCRLLSLCLTDAWFQTTRPRLEPLCTPEWFAPGEILTTDILGYDFAEATRSSRRCLVLWDAHGFDVAECVLAKLLPAIADKPHAVMMHDMCDVHYDGVSSTAYNGARLWAGDNATHDFFMLGNVWSSVAQTISVVDFTTRNRIPLHATAEGLHQEFKGDPVKCAELQRLLGKDLFSLAADWFWFSVNEAAGKVSFPCPRPTVRAA
jgi:hypothetical protein